MESKYFTKDRRTLDTAGVAKRRQARSKYGAKRPKDAKEIFFIIEKDNLNDKGKIHEKRYVNP